MATKKKQPAKKKKSYNDAIIKEVLSIIMIAVSIFFILGVFTSNGGGAVGNLIGNSFKGLLGIGAYALPVIAICISVFVLFDKKKEIPISKIVMGIVLFLLFISLAHIIGVDGNIEYDSIFDYVLSSYSSGSPLNGGLAGALIGNFLLKVLGLIGACILIVASSIIMIMLMTGRSLSNGLQHCFYAIKEAVSGYGSEDDYYDIEYFDDFDEDEDYEEVYVDTTIRKQKKEAAPDKKIKKQSKSVSKKRQAAIYDFEQGRAKRDRQKILLPLEDAPPKKKVASALDIDFSPEEIKAFEQKENAKKEPEERKEEEESFEEMDIKLMGMGIDKELEESTDQIQEIPEEKKETAQVPKEKIAAEKKIVAIKPAQEKESKPKQYYPPSPELLKKNLNTGSAVGKSKILQNSRKLEETLKSFGVDAKVVEVSVGPSVTRYELSPGPGVKVSKISNLSDDLALNLEANGIRIEAPIPGKAAVGIEVPNKEVQTVYFREVIEDESFSKFPSKLAFGLGKDIAGKAVVTDIAKMPHMLIAGATGSGKSVCINTLVSSILYKATPDEVKLIMIDPKVVELSVYNGIPHLLIPVVTEAKKAAGALNWAVKEMLNRYELFATSTVRDLKGYNDLLRAQGEKTLPQIVIIIDELADLMMAAPGEVEDSIGRLAQMARAAGLHLIIATQRPSVDVITGVIKANIPSRLAFAVSSGTDSRTILDTVGAEKLLGKGDMLFYPAGMSKPVRVQGAFISDKEVEAIVDFLKQNAEIEYDVAMEKEITSTGKSLSLNDDEDEFFEAAVDLVIKKEKASASMLQRQFKIGYNRASRLIEDLEEKGIVGQEDGSKPRKVLVTSYQWEEMKNGGSAEKAEEERED